MKRYLVQILFLFSLSSCSIFKPTEKVSQEKIWQELWLAACPTSEGKGQIFISKKTYSFTYESIFNLTDKFWAIAMEVPVRGEETLVVPFDAKAPFTGSMFASLDKKTLNSIGVDTFKAWKKSWVELLAFLQKRGEWSKKTWGKGYEGQENNIAWKFTESEIELKTASFSWKFKRIQDELRFSQQIVTLRHQKNSQTISLHLYPTLCGK